MCGGTSTPEESLQPTINENQNTTPEVSQEESIPPIPSVNFDIIDIYNSKLVNELCSDAQDIDSTSEECLRQYRVNLELSKFMRKVDDEENKNSLICPMPGKLIELFVKVGDQIEVGQNLCIVEAMKMENTLQSSLKGQVKKINFKVNDLLKVDDIIIEF